MIEAALRRGGASLQFEPPLEAAFERDTAQPRMLRYVTGNLLGTASFVSLSAADAVRYAALGEGLAQLRLAVFGVLMLIFVVYWRLRKTMQRWQLEALSAGGALTISAYGAYIAHRVSAIGDVMHLGCLLLVFLYAAIAVRLQFRYALTVNVCTFLGYAAFANRTGDDAARVVENHLLLFGTVLVFTTVGNFLIELRERRHYLLDQLRSRRHHALLADAEQLRELTVRDGLTGLHNRRHFDTELARAWAQGLRSDRPLALLQVDVDHFKRYNDRYGHPAGDACLVGVAGALDAVAGRHGGIAARVGGEEFALLLPAADTETATRAAADACAAVRALAIAHGASTTAPHVTVSVGIAALKPGAGLWASTLVGAADAALYAAKSRGRDGFALFEPPLVSTASPLERHQGDSLSQETESPADALSEIERCSGLLERGLRWLRFPADLEQEFQQREDLGRRRRLAALTVAGVILLLVYTFFCRPIYPDIADKMLRSLEWLSLGALAVSAVNLRFALGWRIREGLFTAMVSGISLAIVYIEAQSRSPIVTTATLGVCLLPMFSSLVAAQSLRFSLVASSIACVAVWVLMAPPAGTDPEAWLDASGIVSTAIGYSLIGGYLLELANRRAFLLGRLSAAQLGLLRHNTAHLQRLAAIDPLTRLPNRRRFEAELDRLAADCARSRQPLGLLILDIDHFKLYNDGYGHPAGDACLQHVGALIAEWARDAAGHERAGCAPVPARIGGEEFGVLLPGSDASAALAAAQRVRELLHGLRIEHAHSPSGQVVTVSVGAASLILESAADARLLLKAADAALYRAKRLGRDRAAA